MTAYGRKRTFGLSLNASFLTAAFGGKSGHWGSPASLIRADFTGFWTICRPEIGRIGSQATQGRPYARIEF